MTSKPPSYIRQDIVTWKPILASNTVILTCPECHLEFEMLRWQFEIDIEEEGEGWEPVCPSCQGIEDVY